MFTPSWFHRTNRKPRVEGVLTRQPPRLRVELLEGRLCPSGGYLVVGSFGSDSVLRYNEATGAFVDAFVPPKSGGLRTPFGVIFGPDHNLYVASDQGFNSGVGHDAILRFDGATGTFLDDFARDKSHLTFARTILFGPDGNLYVANRFGPGAVLRFNGATGAFMDDFVLTGSGGLDDPTGMVFGPSGANDGKLDLYVGQGSDHGNILRFDGTTGAFKGTFVPSSSGGLKTTQGMVFGPDGNLYVSDGNFHSGRPDWAPGSVLRFEGPTGSNPGAFLGKFVPGGRGGLSTPAGLLFGPDGNGDGKLDLYVTSTVVDAQHFAAEPGTSQVLRFDGVTGAFLDTFVTPDSGGLRFPAFMTFTETDPTTLNYTGGERLSAAGSATGPMHAALRANRAQPLFAEAVRRSEAAGIDMSALHGIDIRIAALGGTTLGLASGHTSWPDDNAGGWGWFLDRTLRNDSEFTRRGDRGEKRRMDLLTVMMHEAGHLLGRGHEGDGVMQDSLPAGTRRTVDPVPAADAVGPGVDLTGLTSDEKKT